MRSTIFGSILCISLVAASPTAPQPANDCPNVSLTQTFENGVTCTGSCHGDRHGGDYKAAYAGSFQQCAAICAGEPTGKCLTAQYNEDNGYCYLKSVVESLDTASTNTDTWDCCPGQQVFGSDDGSSTTVCTPICSTDRTGGDYDRTQTNSFNTCIQMCGTDPECVTAQYHVSTGFCYFKNTVNAASTDLGVETVDCVTTTTID